MPVFSGRSIVWVLAVLTIFLLAGRAPGATAYAQVTGPGVSSSGAPAWVQALETAAAANDAATAGPLLRAHRLDIGDMLSGWIRAGLQERMAATTTDPSGTTLRRAARIAEWYREEFREGALMLQVGFAAELPDDRIADKLRADSLHESGVARRGQADLRDAARTDLLAAERIYEEIGDLAGLAATKGQLGYVSWFLDRDAYLTYNEEALALRRRLGDRKLIGNTLNDLGLYHRVIARQYTRALDHYLESERVRWAIGDSIPLSRTLPNIALSFEALGRFDDAEAYYRKAANLYLAVGDTARWITQRNNAAGILTDYMERHSDALVEMLGLRDDLRMVDDPRAEALVTNSLGVVSRRLGDFESAIAYYQDVIELSETHGFDDLLAGAHNNIGVVFIWLGRPDRAEPFFERALDAAARTGSASGRLDALVNLGSASFEQRAYDRSIVHLSEAAALADSLSRDITSAKVQMGLGNARLRAGGPASARPAYVQALAVANEYELPELRMGIYFGFGDAAEANEQPDSAYVWYEKGIAAIESARGLLRAEEDRAGFIAQTTYLYEDYIDFLTRMSEADADVWMARSFLTAERSKARVFSEQLAEATAGVRQSVDSDLAKREQVMIDSLAYVRSLIPAAADRERRAMLREYLRDLEIRFATLERDIRSQNPAYADLVYPRPASLSDLQASLAPGQAVLSYSVGDSSSALWAVSRDDARLVRLPSRSALKTQVDVLRFALEDPTRTTPRAYGLTAQSLYDVLVRPAADMLDGATSILVMPHDLLNYVPFEALVSSPGDTWTGHDYLIHAADITYVSSATAWLQLAKRSPVTYSHDLLAVGNPDFGGTNAMSALRNNPLEQLPFTGAEIESVQQVVGPDSRSVVLLGSDATEEGVRRASAGGTYRFVHFATHGLIDDNRPDYSALALTRPDASTRPGEGLLQASEIFNLSFDSELVVLSACETGLGQLVQGEGMVGLTRAFMYAGARSVMASLWAVSDESTAALMGTFYAHAAGAGQSPAAALRQAKRDMIFGPWAHPFHWAPFILTGRP